MNIVILSGSPHKKGTSALLADAFTDGARQAGHTVTRFDCAFLQVGGCRGCDYCGAHDGVCVQRDDMAQILPAVLAADVVVFASGVYYFGLTAQLKAVIDRFYAGNSRLMTQKKRAALLITCADSAAPTVDATVAHYHAVCDYLGWQDAGMVTGLGLSTRADAEASDYPARAKALALAL